MPNTEESRTGANVTCLPNHGREPVKQSRRRGRLPNDVAKFQPRQKSQDEIDAEESKRLDDELKASCNALIDARIEHTRLELKRMDNEDAEIVMAELAASIARVKRATQLAKMQHHK